MEEKYIGISIKPNEDDTLEHKWSVLFLIHYH